MHRARHSGASSSFRRPRVVLLLLVAGVGLAGALWLPSRYDAASATENGATEHGRTGWQARDQHGDGWWDHWRRRHHRERRHHWSPPITNPGDGPTTAPPTTAPPTNEPPAATPSTSEAPDVAAWKPFTDYTAGQLVRFGGVVYQVQEAHTSLPGWEPSKVPQLFKVVPERA